MMKQEKKNYPCGEFYHADGSAFCINVDSEPKVIQKLASELNGKKERHYRNMIYQQSGCGNNWALGYSFGGEKMEKNKKMDGVFGDYKEKNLVDRTLDVLQREMMRMDYVKGIVLMVSTSGGTGSGVGSRLIRNIRCIYPDICIMCVTVSAFRDGDTTLQNFNTLLSLSYFQRYSDAVFLFHNDDVAKLLTKTKKACSTKDINQYIATCLIQLMLPRRGEKDWTFFDPRKFITHVCPDKWNNLIEVYTSSLLNVQNKLNSWQYHCDHFLKTVPSFDLKNKPIKSIALELIIRGSIQTHDRKLVKSKISKLYKPIKWNETNAIKMKISNAKALPSQKIQMSITVAANRSNVMEFLNQIMTKSFLMLEINAYVHHYYRYGSCSQETFNQAMNRLQRVIIHYAENFHDG